MYLDMRVELSRHDARAGFAAQRPCKIRRVGDDGLGAAHANKFDSSFNFREHTARRKMTFCDVLLSFGKRHLGEKTLIRLVEIERNLLELPSKSPANRHGAFGQGGCWRDPCR